MIVSDGDAFVVLRRNLAAETISMQFVFPAGKTGSTVPLLETVDVFSEDVSAFLRYSEIVASPFEKATLSVPFRNVPKLTFCEQTNLRRTAANRTLRRKLVRMLRDYFQAREDVNFGSMTALNPTASYFRKSRMGRSRNNYNRLSLCGQDDLETAYYTIFA